MGEFVTFRLPDLGEGLADAEILRWLVAVGDEVAVNQPLCEVETAKAAVEIPSPHAGWVRECGAAEGAVLAVGAPLAVIETEQVREPVLVGYGPRGTGTPRRRRRLAARGGGAEPVRDDGPVPTQPGPPEPGGGRVRPLAKPPVRKLARDLGIDLVTLHGSGPGGIVTRADVERAVPTASVAPPVTASGRDVDRIPIRGIRRATAEAMVRSAAVPQASVRLTVDVTDAVALLARAPAPASFLALVVRAVTAALQTRPMLNARWDEAEQEIVVPATVDVGIAVAGPRGLLVPKLRGAGERSVTALTTEIAGLAERARDGRCTPGELRDGTFTISNVGVFGVDGGTALLTPGETAILCVGAARERPWVADGQLSVRRIVELTLTIDHRVVDGADAARFLADLAGMLADPGLMLLR